MSRANSFSYQFIIGLLVAGLLATWPTTGWSQLNLGSIPNQNYWLAMNTYYDGDLVSARRAFQDAARSGIATADGRWVDSICFHTMLGECDYQLGNLASALDQYTSALKLYQAQQNWMLQVDFPATIEPLAAGKATPWGTSNRNGRLGHFPDRYTLMQNTLSATPADAGGNFSLVTGKQAVPVYAAEIARCTALAIRRRRELLAMVSPRDPFTDQLVLACNRRPAPPNSWSSCWTDVHVGLAYAAAGKTAQAVSELNKALLAGSMYDHQLTSLALLELGQIAFHEGKFDAAGALFLEATYSAAQFGYNDDIEEGLRQAYLCWILSGKNTEFTPLLQAIAWANSQGHKKLEVALRIIATENLNLANKPDLAAAMLASAQKAMYRSEMQAASYGAHFNFELARAQFTAGDMNGGNTALAAAMKFQQASSRWLFQIALADSYVSNGTITERDADVLYSEVLRDPTPRDWASDALEALTVASSSYATPIEHAFSLALARKEPEKALEIADRLRRHRFYSTLPLGGRLLSLRWILEAPNELLTPAAQLRRQELLVKHDRYARASGESALLQKELAALPLVPADEITKKQQSDALLKLAKVSAAQEVMLREIALRREPTDYVFPPSLAFKEMQAKLPERTLVLCFLNVGGKLQGFTIGRERMMPFTPDAQSKIKADLGLLFKTWGLVDRNQMIHLKDLQNNAWRPIARRILKTLTNNMKDENWAHFDEVVVVPDGLLWYVPWEAMPLGDDPADPLLVDRVRVRVVPSLSLAVPDPQPKLPLDRAAVVAGKLYPRDDVAIATSAFEELKKSYPNANKLMSNIPAASSLLLSSADQLVVYHDMDDLPKAMYDWAPCPVDKARSGSALAEWFSLPWRGPRQVILPGFHTAAESGLRKGGTGDELFFTSCALMSAGVRTMLVSRWRNGGETSYNLVREFAGESPYGEASVAWQRAIQLAKQQPLTPEAEPKIENTSKTSELTAAHPVFWSGYLLIDTGAKPVVQAADKKPAPKVEAKPEPAKADAAKPEEKAGEKKEEAKSVEAPQGEGEKKIPAEVEALKPPAKK